MLFLDRSIYIPGCRVIGDKMKADILEKASERVLLLDSAMGTMLQRKGLKSGRMSMPAAR